MLDALMSLRDKSLRPFTPQAGDHKLEGEVADILDHCVGHAADEAWGGDNSNPESQKDFFGFLSHHKMDAGDSARIFVDNARMVVRKRPDHARYGKIDNLIFLDSNNLTELWKLLDFVRASKNYILMLSRDTLNRPWVLAELCAAYQDGLHIVVVLVEFPGHEKNSKMFRFPKDLEASIAEWTEYNLQNERNQRSKALPLPRLYRRSLTKATSVRPEEKSVEGPQKTEVQQIGGS
jgi:hypothetical protein